MVSHQVLFHQGGLYHVHCILYGLSSGWSLIRVIFHQNNNIKSRILFWNHHLSSMTYLQFRLRFWSLNHTRCSEQNNNINSRILFWNRYPLTISLTHWWNSFLAPCFLGNAQSSVFHCAAKYVAKLVKRLFFRSILTSMLRRLPLHPSSELFCLKTFNYIYHLK